MSLLVDLTALQPSQGKFHGAGEYGKSVLLALLERKEANISGYYDPTRWFDPALLKRIKKSHMHLVLVSSESELQTLLSSGSYSRYYSALPYKLYNFDFSGIDLIYTIHGLRDLEMPTDTFEARYPSTLISKIKACIKALMPLRYKKHIVKKFERLISANCRSRTILVPSNHTKFSLLNFFPELSFEEVVTKMTPDKASVKNKKMSVNSFVKKFALDVKSYALLISGNRWIKNPIRAIRAFDRIFSEHPDLGEKVVVLGAKRPLTRIENSDRFIWVDYVEEEELEAFYEHASFFVYPTLNEGFGLPPLEAMKYGTPVVASAISAVPEICLDAALYFQPFCEHEIKSRLLMMLFDLKLRKKYASLAKKRYAKVVKQQEKELADICDIIVGK